ATVHALRLCVALAHFWAIRGYVTEGRQWLRTTLELADQEAHVTVAHATALSWAGWFAELQGEIASAAALCQQSLDLSKRLGDRRILMLTLRRLGFIASSQGDDAAACALLEESVRYYQTSADTSGLAYSLMELSRLAIGYREPDEIRTWLQQSL